MPNVESLLTVIAPRDFERCDESDTAFFKVDQARQYVFGDEPGWLLYVENLRPFAFIRSLRNLAEYRTAPNGLLVMDSFGSGPLRTPADYRPEPRFDDRCFAALARFERAMAARHVKLVVASVPTMPEWRARFDPTGSIQSGFKARLRAALSNPGTTLIFGDSYRPLSDADFADPVHLLWPQTAGFTRFLFERILPAQERVGKPSMLRVSHAF